jgi:hypothetical protein
MTCISLPNDILDSLVDICMCDMSRMCTLKSTFAYVYRTCRHVRPVRLCTHGPYSDIRLHSMCSLDTSIHGQRLLYTIRPFDGQGVVTVELFFAHTILDGISPHSLTVNLMNADGRSKARQFIHHLDFGSSGSWSEFKCASSFATMIPSMGSVFLHRTYASIDEFLLHVRRASLTPRGAVHHS